MASPATARNAQMAREFLDWQRKRNRSRETLFIYTDVLTRCWRGIEYHVPLAWEDSGDAVGTKLADGWNDGVSLAIAAGDLVALAGDVRPGAPLELWPRSGESTLVVARLDIPADVKPGATVNAEFDGTAAKDELPSDLSDVDPASFGASLRMAS